MELSRTLTRRDEYGFDHTGIWWRCGCGHHAEQHEMDPKQRGKLLPRSAVTPRREEYELVFPGRHAASTRAQTRLTLVQEGASGVAYVVERKTRRG